MREPWREGTERDEFRSCKLINDIEEQLIKERKGIIRVRRKERGPVNGRELFIDLIEISPMIEPYSFFG